MPLKCNELEDNKLYRKKGTVSLVDDGQLNIYGEDVTAAKEKNVWDTSVKVEENGYYWNKEPYFKKGANINTPKPIVAELFCGCGGTSLGFEMAGFEAILGCDIHAPSIQTFQTNHPNCATILGDIKKVDPNVLLELLNGQPMYTRFKQRIRLAWNILSPT